MKLKKLAFILPLFASLTALAGCGENNPDKEEEEKREGLKATYYKDINFNSTRLVTQLQQLNFSKHKVYIKYGQFNSYCSTTDDRKSVENVPGTKKNQWFYTGKEASGYGTREHVWPCANSASLWTHDGSGGTGVHNVDNSNYVGGGSDLFHVRTANSTVNTARGNSKFVDFDDPECSTMKGKTQKVGESNGKYDIEIFGATKNNSTGVWEYAQKCEVDDHMKGDVARILLYVWMAYGDRGAAPTGSVTSGGKVYKYQDMCGSLDFTNILGYDSMERCAEKLVEWCKLDPISDVEKQRNETVAKIQGNRNPFYDFPDLPEKVLYEFL